MTPIKKYRFPAAVNNELDGRTPRHARNPAMPKHFRMIDNARRTLTAIENSAVDELLAGRMDRRDFLR
ncbi:hypothetical protein EN947_10505, partial [Mesorhizobium sp. M7A.F.Ca.US.003.02.2.1]